MTRRSLFSLFAGAVMAPFVRPQLTVTELLSVQCVNTIRVVTYGDEFFRRGVVSAAQARQREDINPAPGKALKA